MPVQVDASPNYVASVLPWPGGKPEPVGPVTWHLFAPAGRYELGSTDSDAVWCPRESILAVVRDMRVYRADAVESEWWVCFGRMGWDGSSP
jgi:hypothetical protein